MISSRVITLYINYMLINPPFFWWLPNFYLQSWPLLWTHICNYLFNISLSMSNRHLKSTFLKWDSWFLSSSNLFLLHSQAELTSTLPFQLLGPKNLESSITLPFPYSHIQFVRKSCWLFLQSIFIIWSLLISITPWSKSLLSLVYIK